MALPKPKTDFVYPIQSVTNYVPLHNELKRGKKFLLAGQTNQLLPFGPIWSADFTETRKMINTNHVSS